MRCLRGGKCERCLQGQPLFVAAVVAVCCLLFAGMGLLWGLAVALGLGVLGYAMSGWKTAIFWMLTGVVAVAVHGIRVESSERAELELLSLGEAQVHGVALEDGRGSTKYWAAPARLDSGSVVWWQGRGQVPVAGSSLRALGEFLPLRAPRNPGEFDREAWLRRQGVVAEFRQGYKAGEVATGPWAALGSSLRGEFRRRITIGLGDESVSAQVIRAVVMGERPPSNDELTKVFRHSGTLHVFSVSGLHVAMVGSLGWLLLSWLGVPRRWAAISLLPLIFGYAWITGANPPAVRAAWMASLFLGAFVFRRQPNLLNALGLVLWLGLLWDGRQLYQPGVQLSYGVVAVIALANPLATRVFAWMAKPELYLPLSLMTRPQKAWLGLRQRVAQSLSVSLAAGIGSAPLTAWHFGLVTPISIVASVVLVPMVFVLLALALFGLLVSVVAEPVAGVMNRCNGALAGACVKVADGFASVPGGHFRWGADDRPMLLVYDLGYGEQSACFSGGAGEGAVLIDCGGSRSFQYQLAPSLNKLGVVPDSVVLTHPDSGHLGSERVWDELPIRQALLPVKASRSKSYQAWLSAAPAAGVKLYHASELAAVNFPDDAVLEIIYVPSEAKKNARADQRVAVYRLVWNGWKILFVSDAGMETEMAMLDAGCDVEADLIIAGNNRADVSLSDRFIKAVNPRAMILSNHSYPVDERRSPERVHYWRSLGIEVFDQAECGAVTIRVADDQAIELDGFVSGQSVRLVLD